jgi:hypothetical protein
MLGGNSDKSLGKESEGIMKYSFIMGKHGDMWFLADNPIPTPLFKQIAQEAINEHQPHLGPCKVGFSDIHEIRIDENDKPTIIAHPEIVPDPNYIPTPKPATSFEDVLDALGFVMVSDYRGKPN